MPSVLNRNLVTEEAEFIALEHADVADKVTSGALILNIDGKRLICSRTRDTMLDSADDLAWWGP